MGDIEHIANQSDCISSIAEHYGHFWKTIWDHPENGELRKEREDPNVLRAGDQVTVPAIRQSHESGETDQIHRFRRRGVPVLLRLRFLDEGQPRSDVEFVANVDGAFTSGRTDTDGHIELYVSPRARIAKITLREDDIEDRYEIEIGRLEPADSPGGVRARLENLGYDCRDGSAEHMEDALSEFQLANGLDGTGELDDATCEALLNAHQS